MGRILLSTIRSESLQHHPDIVNTKIYSLDPGGKESRLIFADENGPIMLLARRGKFRSSLSQIIPIN